VIGTSEAMKVYAGMTWTRLKRGYLLRTCAALIALPVVIAVPLVIAGQWGGGFFENMLEVYFRFIVPFVPALLASPCVAEEIENRTFTFVFARPAPRAALVFGKYVAIVVPAVIAVVLSVAIVWLLAMLRFREDMPGALPLLLRGEAAAVLGVLVFSALACAFGSMFTKHPFVAVAVYLLIVEAGIGSTPIVLHVLAVSWHLRNLTGLLPASTGGFLSIDIPAWGSALWVCIVGFLGLGGAALSISGAEYHLKD
jgi:ABC-type transport system involved in multi-copper enzyme maturation permease subunit